MRSISNLDQPAALPVLADDVLEFHAARLLLLFRLCGTASRIDGLTKMAKLDFFVRYPEFFRKVCDRLGVRSQISRATVESSMVRFHYGPWDPRYYHVLSYLEAKGLITVSQVGKQFQLKLTDPGKQVADTFANEPAFASLTDHMKQVKRALGDKSGNRLKKLIYEVFDQEVASRPLGEVIE